MNLIDTAECYGDHTSESLIGHALHGLRARDKFIIATKFGHHFVANFQRTEPFGVSPAGMFKSQPLKTLPQGSPDRLH